jgi:hypothetical protein
MVAGGDAGSGGQNHQPGQVRKHSARAGSLPCVAPALSLRCGADGIRLHCKSPGGDRKPRLAGLGNHRLRQGPSTKRQGQAVAWSRKLGRSRS